MAFLLHQLLSQSATRYPDKQAIFFRNQSISYADLERESNRLAHSLLCFGTGRGDRVGIFMNRCIESIVGAFAILKAGATYVPLDPTSPPARLGYIVDRCKVSSLLTSQERLPNLERAFPQSCPLEYIIVMNGPGSQSGSIGTAKIVDWPSIREGARVDAPNTDTIDSDLAYVLFTSGSTGNPKGVMISHRNSLTFVNSAHDFFQIEADDRFSNICPLHFDMSVFDLYVAFKAGASVVIIPENTSTFPSELANFIDKNKISVWNSVPSALSLLANFTKLENYDFSSLRLVLFAGEILPIKHLRRLKEWMPEAMFYNIYGQTEANSSTYYLVKDVPVDDTASLPIGKTFPNFDVFAVDGDGKRVNQPGTNGELYVRASSVAMGYWDDAEKTAECFVRNPLKPHSNEIVYRTGDLVRLDADGNYVFLGRKDHMVKSRGYRIEIGEIETVLSTHEGIKIAVVIPIPDEVIGNRIAVVIVPAMKDSLGKDDIIKHCAKRLPKYMIPEIIEFHDSLPMTSSGKVDRKAIGGAMTNPNKT